eukprot:CAMPEP_0176101380 /NCGR_PEP_ID=MMETSP0120_2-20121206/50850_1 /TAXON_ID=160619 /ORGANISM="Kryptoperidinium foliaceum, Strain CCMP 1326" /LENGTH=111 /DNA_ID=CAMNT_0017435433 /DNA_START=30 /DNA_END=361 /DNA_ORIENTATION=+
MREEDVPGHSVLLHRLTAFACNSVYDGQHSLMQVRKSCIESHAFLGAEAFEESYNHLLCASAHSGYLCGHVIASQSLSLATANDLLANIVRTARATTCMAPAGNNIKVRGG